MHAQSASAVHPDVARILLDEARIQARIKELGQQISRDYQGRPLTLVGILKGSVVFLADLMRQITTPCSIDFMAVSSYSGTESTGSVRISYDLRGDAEGRDLLIVEDIIDTGLTLNRLEELLRARSPRSLEICALLDKPDCRKAKVDAKYVGFKIPNEFVVGYGLDYNERYRELPYVGILKR